MSATTIIYLIIQIVAGAIGGNIFAKITQFTLGPIVNAIVGAVGGAIGGFIFQGLGPELTSSGVTIGAVLLQTAIGAVSGAILTVFASLFMNPIDYYRDADRRSTRASFLIPLKRIGRTGCTFR